MSRTPETPFDSARSSNATMTLSKCLQILDQFASYYTKDIYDNIKEEILNSNPRVLTFFRAFAQDRGKLFRYSCAHIYRQGRAD